MGVTEIGVKRKIEIVKRDRMRTRVRREKNYCCSKNIIGIHDALSTRKTRL